MGFGMANEDKFETSAWAKLFVSWGIKIMLHTMGKLVRSHSPLH